MEEQSYTSNKSDAHITFEELDALFKKVEADQSVARSARLYQHAYENGWFDGIEIKRLPVLPEAPPLWIKPLSFDTSLELDRSPGYINFMPRLWGDLQFASILRSFEVALDSLKGRMKVVSGQQTHYDRQRQYHCGKKSTRKMRRCWYRKRAKNG